MKTHNVQQNNETAPQGSYLKNMVFGALAGRASKYFLPVMKHEKNAEYRAYLAAERVKANTARQEALQIIRNSASTPERDAFISMVDNNKLKGAKLSEIRPVRNMLSQVNDAKREAFETGKKFVKGGTKGIRAAAPFVFAGTAIAFASTLAYNIINSNSKNS